MFTPNCDVFWVGSYPLKDPLSAGRRILKNTVLLPHWPQLPRRGKREHMIDQTFAGMRTRQGFPKGTASGWNAIFRLMKGKSKFDGEYFKTQLAGPITLFGKLEGSGRTKNKKKILSYVSDWLDHAFWQVDQLKGRGLKPIIILDEPMLPQYMGPISAPRARRVLKLLRSIVKRLKKRGAVVGIHCCNRISPTTLMDLGVDLVHFDAYYFQSQITASREQLQRFLVDGGIIAWGVVPTSEMLTPMNQAKIEKNFSDLLAAMASKGLPLRRVLAQSMVAPTCGTGLLTIEQSDRIMAFATSLSKQLKSRYKL